MGMLYKQPGSRKWWCKYYVNGRPIRESTSTQKEKEAEGILKEREGRAAVGVAGEADAGSAVRRRERSGPSPRLILTFQLALFRFSRLKANATVSKITPLAR